MSKADLAKSNADIVRTALEGVGVEIEPTDGNPNLTTIKYRVGDVPAWTAFLFTNSSNATVDMYSVILHDVTNIDRLRVLECINYINYKYLYRGHFELTDESTFLLAPRIRFKGTFNGIGKTINPLEFLNSYDTQMNATYIWYKILEITLSSSRPVGQIIDEAWNAKVEQKST